MSHKYWLELPTGPDKYAEMLPHYFNDHAYRVSYGSPEMGFRNELMVTEQMLRILEIAVQVGREQAKAEIRRALGAQ